MKLIRSILFVSIAFLSFTACSKDSDDSTPTAGVVSGKWEGKWGNDNDKPSLFFSLNFKDGGILEEYDQTGEVKGVGTWSYDITNKIITGHTINQKAPVGNKYSIIAAFYPSQGKVLGNWGFGGSATDGGTFELTVKK